VLAELEGAAAAHLLRALRLVLASCRGRMTDGTAHTLPDVAGWAASLEEPCEDIPRDALRGLAAALMDSSDAAAEAVSSSCYELSEWAEQAGAEGTSLLFAQAAALAHPECARSAWKTGRMLRDHGKMRDAEVWLRRASRIAVWKGDLETQNLAINSLGNMYNQQGSYHEALRCLTRAYFLAHRLSAERRGAVAHDLVVVSIALAQYSRAEEFAVAAARHYGPQHHNLPRLAHDVALLWGKQGKYTLAKPLYAALLPTLSLPEIRMRTCAAAARCAGACSDTAEFERYWAEGWTRAQSAPAHFRNVLPAVLVDLGFGAVSLGVWDKATAALDLALRISRETTQHDSASEAEVGLEMVARYERVAVNLSRPVSPSASALTNGLVRSLKGLAPVASLAGAPSPGH
jgi:tetratricopeptide (TPR) repeat protein